MTPGMRRLLVRFATSITGSLKYEYMNAQDKARARGLEKRGFITIGESKMHASITDAGRVEVARWGWHEGTPRG